jgi:DNA invertase Pin-like site-specific DNA recombinase
MSKAVKPVRCAIYTRKSSEEGLEQDFNSLDAQREACEAYVKSQVGEGWVCLGQAFDDGGFSGGNMERPGLKALLAAIASGQVDVVVVYKVDRLTRSLGDFARIVEAFDAKGVSFVSVTQAFNTTTSMGRLTLNVLLSFAQFEREVTGERIRDKIAASKKKGLWMGGAVPLGYDPDGRTLKINEAEAATVRHIFQRYLALGSVHTLRLALEADSVRSKVTTKRNGEVRGGVPLNRGGLFHMLSNRLYLGEIPHKGEWHPGQHKAIVDAEIFEQVQQMMAKYGGPKRRAALGLPPLAPNAPLTGLLRNADGARFSPVCAKGKSGALYRYYVLTDVLLGPPRPQTLRRLPAPPLEALVLERLRAHGLLPASEAYPWPAVREALVHVEVAERELRLAIKPEAWAARRPAEDCVGSDRVIEGAEGALIVSLARLRRRGVATTIITPRGEPAGTAASANSALLRGLIRAEGWKAEILGGKGEGVIALAARDGLKPSYVRRLLRLAFLAPDLKRSILQGRPSPGLVLQRLMTEGVPDLWAEQRQAAG